MVEVAPGDAVQGGGGDEQLAAQAFAQDLAAGGLGLDLEVAGAAGRGGPERGERRLAGRVVQDGGGVAHEVVAGGAVGQPVGGEALVRGEDLLDPDDRAVVAQIRRRARLQRVQPAAQLAAVFARVGEAVDMVDAHAVDQALGVEAEHGAVRRLEHFRHLCAHAGEAVDVEEAAPVDLVGGGAPPGEPVVLAFEQAVQPLLALPACRRVGAQRLVDRGARRRAAAAPRALPRRAARTAARPPGPSSANSARGVSSGPPTVSSTAA